METQSWWLVKILIIAKILNKKASLVKICFWSECEIFSWNLWTCSSSLGFFSNLSTCFLSPDDCVIWTSSTISLTCSCSSTRIFSSTCSSSSSSIATWKKTSCCRLSTECTKTRADERWTSCHPVSSMRSSYPPCWNTRRLRCRLWTRRRNKRLRTPACGPSRLATTPNAATL